jgi:hypothetical protein
MKEPVQPLLIEPRWPVALTALAVLLLLIALLVPMAAIKLTTARTRWLRVERTIALLFLQLRRVERSLC